MSDLDSYALIFLVVFSSVLILRALQKHHDQVMDEIGRKRESCGEEGDGDVTTRD